MRLMIRKGKSETERAQILSQRGNTSESSTSSFSHCNTRCSARNHHHSQVSEWILDESSAMDLPALSEGQSRFVADHDQQVLRNLV
jgi:hypothetical protein